MRLYRKPLALILAGALASGSVGGLLTLPEAMASTTSTTVTVPEPPMTSLDTTAWQGQLLIDQGTVFEGLYGYGPNGSIVPKIATGYKISNGGRTWTFTLRKTARWSNGDPVTANDFYYSWMRQLAPSDGSAQLWASVVNVIQNAYAYHAGAASASQVGIKVVNAYTLQVTTVVPQDLLPLLVLSGSMPLNQKATEAHPTNWWLPQNFVGDGPYVVKSFVTNGEVQLVRNSKYVGATGQFNVGNVQQINLVPNPTVPVEDYMANKLNIAMIGSTADYSFVKSHPSLKSQLHMQIANELTYLQYDNSVDPSPLDNVKVRQAIALVINRQPIVTNVLSGMAGVTNVFGYPGWPAAKYETGVPYNVAKARLLLKEAGYPNGKGIPTLMLYCQTVQNAPEGVPTAEAIQQELQQALGINFKITPLNSTLYGSVSWGGENAGILPGYNIAGAVANWDSPNSFDMGGSNSVGQVGTFGYSSAFRKHAYVWYTTAYDPSSVKAYGDPTNSKMGISWNDWKPLQAAAMKDINWMQSWYAKQPEPYRNEVKPQIPLMTQWNKLVSAWKAATTNSAKHSAWVLAWDFVGNRSTGNGTVGLGLDGQVYWDKNQPEQVHNWRMWQTEFQNDTNPAQAAQIAGKLMTSLMQAGYAEPLYNTEYFFLAKPGIENVITNPWSWGNFYQLQYLTVK